MLFTESEHREQALGNSSEEKFNFISQKPPTEPGSVREAICLHWSGEKQTESNKRIMTENITMNKYLAGCKLHFLFQECFFFFFL